MSTCFIIHPEFERIFHFAGSQNSRLHATGITVKLNTPNIQNKCWWWIIYRSFYHMIEQFDWFWEKKMFEIFDCVYHTIYNVKLFSVMRLRAGLPCLFPRHGHHHLCHYHVLLWKGDFNDDDDYDDDDDDTVAITIFATIMFYCEKVTLAMMMMQTSSLPIFRMWKAVLLSPSQHPFGTPSSLWPHLGELPLKKSSQPLSFLPNKNYHWKAQQFNS